MEKTYILREADAGDSEFVEQVYCRTREEDFAVLGWPGEQLAAFLKMQAGIQKRAYEMQFPGALCFVIEHLGRRVGRIITETAPHRIHLIDIAVLPEFRNLGIGTAVIGDLTGKAAEEGRNLSLRVEKQNTRALSLYRRLGLKVVGEDDLGYLMESDLEN